SSVLISRILHPPRSTLFPYTTLFRSHILVLTTSSEEDNVVASIEAGASGYLLKDVGRMDIVRSIRDLQEGDSPVSQAVVRHLIADRKSTRLNSSHVKISYAVFCLKKK